MEQAQLATRLKEAKESGRLNLRCAASWSAHIQRRPPGAAGSHLDRTHITLCSYLGAPALVEDALEQALAAAGVRITELDLSSNELRGDTLPLSLAAFPHLRVLRLKYNRLAALPSLAQLPRLQQLDLDGNQIGALGEGELAALPEGLRHLSLSSNWLAAVPDGLGVTCCRALTHLDVSNNPLTALPDSLGSCPALTHLDVSSCRLTVLPASLAQCRTLQRFFCQVGLPECACPVLRFPASTAAVWHP